MVLEVFWKYIYEYLIFIHNMIFDSKILSSYAETKSLIISAIINPGNEA